MKFGAALAVLALVCLLAFLFSISVWLGLAALLGGLAWIILSAGMLLSISSAASPRSASTSPRQKNF